MDWITTYPFSVFRPSARNIAGHPATKGDVIIGNDVWIGSGATILSGVKIGNGSVIGACAVITRDVPAYTIVAGNPARCIKQRFSDQQIIALESTAWWEWSDEDLDRVMPILLSGDIERLITFSRERDVVAGKSDQTF